MEQVFPWLSTVITALITGGLFSFIQFLINRHDNKEDELKEIKDAIEVGLKETQNLGKERYETHEKAIQEIHKVLKQLEANDTSQTSSLEKQATSLVGIGHDRIVYLGAHYLERGYITQDEYENLNDYLFKPYKALGGNGTAEKIMKEVDKLPLHDKNKKV